MIPATVIVPSRGPAARVGGLLDSLDSQSVAHETLVVDNDSPEAEVSRLCDRYPFATAIRLERNEGFSRPVNLAAGRAAGEALVLVNDDCVLDPGYVEGIVAALDPDRGVTMAAGVMREAADPERIDTAGMELDRTMLVYDYLNGEPLSALAEARDPIGPSATAAAFDRRAFLALGGFDEKLFAYWEDVDLVLRMLRAGGRCALARGALGTHEHSATLGPGSAAKNGLMGFGRAYTLRKWGVVQPRRLPAILARELPLIAGQALIDRNLAGIGGRLRGWRAARPTERFPAEALAGGGGGSLGATLRRRLARRRRLRRGRATG